MKFIRFVKLTKCFQKSKVVPQTHNKSQSYNMLSTDANFNEIIQHINGLSLPILCEAEWFWNSTVLRRCIEVDQDMHDIARELLYEKLHTWILKVYDISRNHSPNMDNENYLYTYVTRIKTLFEKDRL